MASRKWMIYDPKRREFLWNVRFSSKEKAEESRNSVGRIFSIEVPEGRRKWRNEVWRRSKVVLTELRVIE